MRIVHLKLCQAVILASLAVSCSEAPQSRRPDNVILLVVDALRADHLGSYGSTFDLTHNTQPGPLRRGCRRLPEHRRPGLQHDQLRACLLASVFLTLGKALLRQGTVSGTRDVELRQRLEALGYVN